MSLSDLASLGSFASGVAVVITLVFLLLQMRQTDRNQRAAMQLGLAARASDMFTRMSEPGIALVATKAMRSGEDLSEAELWIWQVHVNSLLFSWETNFFHYRAGLLDQAAMNSEEGTIRASLTSPAFRAAWQFRRLALNKEFRTYIDNIAAQVPAIQPTEMRPLYRKLLHEQLAQARPITFVDAQNGLAQFEEAMHASK